MRRSGPIKVLIVDDSALVRSILTRVLSAAQDICVVGGANDPFEARDLIIQHRPDVIILDIEMPRMNGLTFLRKLMVHYPVPVIMCSSVAPASSQAALDAIAAGAIDVVSKPTGGGSLAWRALAEDLVEKVRAAAVSMPTVPRGGLSSSARPTSFREAGIDPDRCLVVIGASTGGTEAIKTMLSNVPADFPPTAIVQHMPEGFTQSFAGRLNRFSPLTVTEAAQGDLLVAGRAFLARGGIQMMLRASAGQIRIQYGTQEPVNRHCPSVDVLFDSATRVVGRQIIGILLTGMGDDGARGLLALRKAGALTIGQDRNSCVVYGMPKVAFEIGAVQHQAPPAEIPKLILKCLASRAKAAAE
ncbi:MAG TPA: chemotaxis response regulator protein-glutamate methylesterase [Phycisphaerae bacterium]|nr:chemotaxis response regulator protein-glutamate methylesterase [Phycisphaerae bacterium]HOM52714.1 chemotaxis response regulator protein-glutamate methylesterase [Phycisphaerae bacterium]HPP25464.1 chemotaxis response regulator protein-glutamate methylesterase [Phycisphaerae bacterium]HPU27984.1 chemotaxis response regulator protein-glutamate methylesterase [Phycisphaerae bacterium]HPZ97746.1 chemotaxis response regulator protein-glutamate methylesterase [Phycisphaerae bacterium]